MVFLVPNSLLLLLSSSKKLGESVKGHLVIISTRWLCYVNYHHHCCCLHYSQIKIIIIIIIIMTKIDLKIFRERIKVFPLENNDFYHNHVRPLFKSIMIIMIIITEDKGLLWLSCNSIIIPVSWTVIIITHISLWFSFSEVSFNDDSDNDHKTYMETCVSSSSSSSGSGGCCLLRVTLVGGVSPGSWSEG